MQKIVIVGGGFAGISVANKLARKTKSKKVSITLIEPKNMNFYEPEYLFWVFKDKEISKFAKPIYDVLSKKVNWLHTSATKIDDIKKTIELSNGETISYDYLVLATGASMEEEQVGTYGENGLYHFYLPSAAQKLEEALRDFQGGTVVVSPSTVPYKCPPAIPEFAFLLDKFAKKKNIRDKTTIKYLYPLMRPYPTPEVAVKVSEFFEKRGIEFVEFFNYESVDTKNKKIFSLEGEEIEYDMLVLIPPHEGHKVIKESGLGDREGFVLTDRHTLKVVDKENIYAVGDCTNLPVSKSGAVSHFSSKALVNNLKAELKGKEPKHKYKGLTICFVVTSFRRSMLLFFSYNFPPRKFGLHNLFIYGLFKKLFKTIYFQALIKGYM